MPCENRSFGHETTSASFSSSACRAAERRARWRSIRRPVAVLPGFGAQDVQPFAGGRRCLGDGALPYWRRAGASQPPDAATRTWIGHVVEGQPERQRHQLHAAPERALFRWHTVLRRGRCLHHAAADGSGAALAHRRFVSLQRRQGHDADYGKEPGDDHVSQAHCRAGQAVRSGGDPVGQIGAEGNVCARPLYHCGKQGRFVPVVETQS